MAESNALAIIPARGGSKRIPRKNIRAFGGRPLIEYTIEAALGAGVFTDVIVSTDSEEIASVAVEVGASLPFMRSDDLADDHTPVSMVTVDALRRLDPAAERYEYVAQLMPNCPFRDARDIEESFAAFRTSDADTQISVVGFDWANPWWAMTLDDERALHPLFPDKFNQRSQDLPKLYAPTGAIWWARSAALLKRETFLVAGRKGWEIHRNHGLDIDTEEDWQFGELLLNSANAGSSSIASRRRPNGA